jgi:hydrogenase maturation protease
VALGQSAAGDDGVGLAVLEELRELELPPGVELRAVHDATALVEIVKSVERVIVVDALVDDVPCGSVRVVGPEELETAALSAVSSHGVSVGQALSLARLLSPERVRDVHVVAIGIDRPCAIGTRLSPAVRDAVPLAVDAVRKLIGA